MGSTVIANFTDMINDVMSFHRRFGSNIGDFSNPKIFNGAFRSGFIREESGETANALIAEDAAEIIDGLCDTLYVTIGAGIEFGISLDDFPFMFINKPRPTMNLADNKERWAREITAVARRCALAIDDGKAIPDIRTELFSMLATCNLALISWGLDVRPFWCEVQRANMEKVPSGSINVKTIKPPGWRGPDHVPILLAQYGIPDRIVSRLKLSELKAVAL